MKIPDLRLPILALLASCSLALAAPLPEGVSTRPNLTDADRGAIRAFVSERASSLATGEPAELQRARSELFDTLARESSVVFRIEVSSALAPTLAELGRGGDEFRAFNAVQLAGVLATDSSLPIIRTALADSRPTVRYAGALASRILFQGVIDNRSSLTDDTVTQLMTELAQRLRAERDPVVAEGMMSAFTVQFPGATGLARRAAAVRAMDDATIELVRAARDSAQASEWTRVFVRAVDASRRLLLDQQVAGQRDETFARAAATLAGHSLAFGLSRLEGSPDASDRAGVGDLLKACEVTLLLSSAQLRRADAGADQPIAQAFDRANDRALRDAVNRWIGQNGLLYQAPFNLPAGSIGR